MSIARYIREIGRGHEGARSLDLAGAGHEVVALDSDPDLLAALRERAARETLAVETVAADARAFDLGDRRVAQIIVPMQTLQLLGGSVGRAGSRWCGRPARSPPRC